MPQEISTLIIDDSEADVDYIRGFLKKLGTDFLVRLTWENDPMRAMLRLAQESFDVVLLDYQMPSMSGLDLLSKIREAHRALPVILLTGMGNESVAVEAMKRGAQDYLRKDQLTVPELSRAILTVLERKRLEEELTEQRRAAESDLRMARELQQAFLPQSLPHFASQRPPDSMGLRFFHHYTPTLSVGGDFFDVFPVGDSAAGVFVSDVAGHGIQAALVTAALRTLIEELKDQAVEPDNFVGEINNGLHRILRQTTSPIFASAFFLKVDSKQKNASFCNAGHPPQLHIRRSRGEVSRLFDKSKAGPLLGQEERAVFPAHTVVVDEQDVFLLFTGGVLDVSNPKDEPFGIVRLENVVKNIVQQSPSEMIDGIVQATSQHAGAKVFPEDLCIVGIEAGSLLVRTAR